MNNLIYSFNATIPVFLVILMGYLLKRIGWMNDGFVKTANKINFNVTLPAFLLKDFIHTDFFQKWDATYVLYCAAVTSFAFFGVWMVARRVMKDQNLRGEFVQSSFRSSAALLGAAFMFNIYGNISMVSLMIIGAVPLYNIYSVLVLTFGEKNVTVDEKGVMTRAFVEILKNPIILSILVGIFLSVFRVSLPRIMDSTIGSLAQMSAPLALLAIGGTFDLGKAIGKLKPAVVATFLKLLGWAILFLPFAIMLGYRDEKLMAIIIMLCSPTTPSCYIMAKNMKCEGTLTGSVIVLSTLFSALTLTFVIFIVKTLGYV